MKGDSGLVISCNDLPMMKVATTVQYTSEFAHEAPQLLQFLANELIQASWSPRTPRSCRPLNPTSSILTGTGTTATPKRRRLPAQPGDHDRGGAVRQAVIPPFDVRQAHT